MKDIINEIQNINKEKDNINNQINILEGKISRHKNNIKSLNYGSLLIILEAILLSILLPSILPFEETIVLMLFFYLTTKAALTIVFGTRKSNKKKIKKFNNIINENTMKNDILAEKINNMKETIRTYNENREKSINNNNFNYKKSYNNSKLKKRILRLNKEKSMAS